MTLQDIIADIPALGEDVKVYERTYGVLSETFYEAYRVYAKDQRTKPTVRWVDKLLPEDELK